MSAIGAFTFFRMDGDLDAASGIVTEEITRPAVNGVALLQTGKRGQSATVRTTVFLSSKAAALSTFQSYKAACGALHNVTDTAENPHANVAVLNVRVVESTPVAGATDVAWKLVCEWELLPTEFA